MVYCIRELNWRKAPSEIKVFRNYAQYDPVKFSDELKGVVWNCDENPFGASEEQNICVDELWTDFETIFLEVADRHAPLIQKKVRGLDNNPWIR